MINTYFGARLIDYSTINVAIFSEYQKDKNCPINLVINDEVIEKLKIKKQSFLNGLVIYECKTENPIELGNSYSITIKDFGITPLIVEDAVDFDDFDKKYTYNGDDLGFTYNKDFTKFKIWAPLASSVTLLIRKSKKERFSSYRLERKEQGVFEIVLKGDYDGYCYRYRVVNNGISVITTDPYGKASSANGKDSCVVDFSKTKIDLKENCLPFLDNYINAVIYELNIRDFTINQNTNIQNKGKFLGMIEENKVTKGGNSCGFDYLKSLGVTHLQLLPIFDFKTVDELNSDTTYNRGYDPQQYFVPEGSYSLDPNDPYSRIVELKKMISKFHEIGIKINMDVVFNHVYEVEFSSFQKVVPNYFFRRKKNGTLSNGSYCGNDVDTKRPMVRKMIVDATKFWIEEYGIDGFRFDLMGLIDIETMNEIINVVKSIKPDAMIYGEGWNMNTELLDREKASIYNSFKLPKVAFFNDVFRDVIRGRNDGNEAGYCLGNLSFKEGFKYAFLGSTTSYCYEPRFLTANQSLNYVECHDNKTLYDRIKVTFGENDEEAILDTIKLINGIIAFSYGISFYHAGQEIGISKFGEDNTYNMGDKYNQFDWAIFDKRIDMVKAFKSILHFKNIIIKNKFFKKQELEENVYFIDLNNGGLIIKIKHFNKDFENAIIAINPTFEPIDIELGDYYRVVVANAGASLNSSIYVKNTTLNAHELNIFMKKMED